MQKVILRTYWLGIAALFNLRLVLIVGNEIRDTFGVYGRYFRRSPSQAMAVSLTGPVDPGAKDDGCQADHTAVPLCGSYVSVEELRIDVHIVIITLV